MTQGEGWEIKRRSAVSNGNNKKTVETLQQLSVLPWQAAHGNAGDDPDRSKFNGSPRAGHVPCDLASSFASRSTGPFLNLLDKTDKRNTNYFKASTNPMII